MDTHRIHKEVHKLYTEDTQRSIHEANHRDLKEMKGRIFKWSGATKYSINTFFTFSFY